MKVMTGQLHVVARVKRGRDKVFCGRKHHYVPKKMNVRYGDYENGASLNRIKKGKRVDIIYNGNLNVLSKDSKNQLIKLCSN